jgi:hypothetical protein
MIAFIGTYLQLKLIITAHNQWLYKTRSILYWITNVFSSTATNSERRTIAHNLNSPYECRVKDFLQLNSPGLNYFPGDPNTDHHLEYFVLLFFSIATKRAYRTVAPQWIIPACCPGNGFQASCLNMVSYQPLSRQDGRKRGERRITIHVKLGERTTGRSVL